MKYETTHISFSSVVFFFRPLFSLVFGTDTASISVLMCPLLLISIHCWSYLQMSQPNQLTSAMKEEKKRKIRTTIIVSVHIVIMMMLINYTSSEAVLLNKSIHVTTVSMPNQWYCMYSTLVMITIQYLPTDNIISPVLYQCIQHFKCGLL